MKPLDEVIKAMENCYGPDAECCDKCQYTKEISAGSICLKCNLEDDALHYLKEYRSDKAMWEADRKGYLNWIEQYKESREKHQQAVIELKKNPPLSWDELKQMEGKPVWVETDNVKFWTIVDNFRTICNQECLCCSKGCMCRSTHARGDWQAYRKERG